MSKRLFLTRYLNLPWWWILATFWLVVLTVDPARRLYDQWFTGAWIDVSIEIIRDADGEIALLYDVDPTRPLLSTWIATAYIETSIGVEQQLFSRRDLRNYQVLDDEPRPWKWATFFESDQPTPPVPYRPFRICLQFFAETIDTGVTKPFGPFCSAIFAPTGD